MKRVFVTGGAGILVAMSSRCLASGYDVLVYDNLSNGHRESALHRKLDVGDLGDRDILGQCKNKECVEMDSKI